jgi:hypothetical protein
MKMGGPEMAPQYPAFAAPREPAARLYIASA